jgi:uncharacterized membrane protein YdbT with pleckstrin-like domain
MLVSVVVVVVAVLLLFVEWLFVSNTKMSYL